MQRSLSQFLFFFAFLYASAGLAHGSHDHHHGHDHHQGHDHHHHPSQWAISQDDLRAARERERQHWQELVSLIEQARNSGVSDAEMVRVYEFDGKGTVSLPRSMMSQIIMASLEHALDKFEIELLSNPPDISGLTPLEKRTAWSVLRGSFSTIRSLTVALVRETLNPIYQGVRHPIQLTRYLGAQWSFLRGSYGMAPATLGATAAGGSYVLTEIGESFVNPFHGGCHWNAYLSAALGFSIMGTFRSAGFLMTYDRELGLIGRVRTGYAMIRTHRTVQKMVSAILIKQTDALNLPTLSKVLRKQVMNEALEQMEHNERTEVDAIVRSSILWADFVTKGRTFSASASSLPLRIFEADARLMLEPSQPLIMKVMKLAEVAANFEALTNMIREDLTKSHLLGERQRKSLRLLGDMERSFARFRFFVQASLVNGKLEALDAHWLESMFEYKLGLLIDLRNQQDETVLKLKLKHWDDIVRTSHRNGRMAGLFPSTDVAGARQSGAPVQILPVVLVQVKTCSGAHTR